jgi:DNA-binding transcriptional LysR family regulator
MAIKKPDKCTSPEGYRASEKLFIAQPALSRQIKELEEELGVKLFDRNRRNVNLTASGEHLYNKSIHIFSQLENIKKELKQIENNEVGSIRIGYVATALYSYLPVFLQKIKNHLPDLQLDLIEMTTFQQIEAVKNGTIDIGFVRCPISDTKLAQKTVHQESFSLVLPITHALAQSGTVALDSLENEPFVFFPRHHNSGYFDKTIAMCFRAGLSPKIQYYGVGSYTLLQMVASGLGISLLPSSISKVADSRVKCIELDYLTEKTELAVIYSEKTLSNAIKALL